MSASFRQLFVTGCGMSAETVSKIFDPFFTTKRAGTGLGLSVSYGIIQEHGGTVQASNVPGNGARFTIDLPALDDHKS